MKTGKSKKTNEAVNSGKLTVVKENPVEAANSTISIIETLQHKLIDLLGNQIPENIPFSKAIGAYGTFTSTINLQKYTRAKIFTEIGKTTKIFTRFSVLGEDTENHESEPHIKEFALRFFTEEGNWDLIGNDTPVLFSKDFKKYIDFFQIPKTDGRTNFKNTSKIWDFLSTNPESLHHVMMAMSDRGMPCGYKHMNGYGSHTFSMLNGENEKFWIKFHFKTLQQIKTFTREESLLARAEDMDYAQRDLVESICKNKFPKWSLNLQIMTDSQAKELDFNPFDVTKTWPKKKFPLIEAGIIELNSIPENYYSEIKQAEFSIANIIDGISYSPDKMLQGRLRSYINATKRKINEEANRTDTINWTHPVFTADNAYINKNYDNVTGYLSSDDHFCTPESWYDYNTTAENDHYSQPSILFNKIMEEPERANLIENIVASMNCIDGLHKDEIIKRQLYHLFRVDEKLGLAIAKGLNINPDNILRHQELRKI